jgi:hypothetical protein
MKLLEAWFREAWFRGQWEPVGYCLRGELRPAWTRLSFVRFSSNRVTPLPFVLTYNVGNSIRWFALPREVAHLSFSLMAVSY